MIPITPELVNAVVDERIRQAEMRSVARSRTRQRRRFDRFNLRWLSRLSELSQPRAPVVDTDRP